MRFRIIFALAVVLLQLNVWTAGAENVKLNGVVVDVKGQPVIGASVLLKGSDVQKITDVDGRFSMLAPDKGTILVTCIGYEDKEVEIDGRNELEIEILDSDIALPEVTVTSMIDKNMKFVFEPSELEVVKNQLLLKTRYKVPSGRFHKDSRLIVQPYLVNYSRDRRTAFTPMVFDGKNYDILVKRGHSCGDEKDREHYSKYAKVVDGLDPNKMIAYVDSCEVEDINDRYATEVYIRINTFCDDDYKDTIVIARGVVYPMRFFDFDAASFDLGDEYAPAQQVLKFNEKGEMHLRFRPSEYKIYEGDGRNGTELRKFRKILNDIEKDTTKALSFFSIKGYTSPEGSYKMNDRLSKRRVKSAVDAILKDVSKESLQRAKIEYDGVVVPWDSVYSRMMRDSLTKEAAELGLLIRRARGNHDEISWGAKRLKSYPVIRDRYLPSFRRVEYNYEYTEMRTLNFVEISELYKKNPGELTASEFWRYIRGNWDKPAAEKERLMREALRYHPDLLIAANNLSALLNREHRADTTVLSPFLTHEAPIEVKVNQTVALLQTRDFERANSLAESLPEVEKTEAVKAITDAMNGRYAQAYEYFGHHDSLNKAILLLCLKKNEEAWQCLERLDDSSAEAEYVRAIAANRLNNVGEAITRMRRALSMKPELKEIMEIDGDVLDLMDYIE